VSLDSVGRIAEMQGDLDAALVAYDEAADVHARLAAELGPLYADPAMGAALTRAMDRVRSAAGKAPG